MKKLSILFILVVAQLSTLLAWDQEYQTTNFTIRYTTIQSDTNLVYNLNEDNGLSINLPDGSTQNTIAGNNHPDYIETIGIYLEYSRSFALIQGYNYPTNVNLNVTVKDLQSYPNRIFHFGSSNYNPSLIWPDEIFIDNDMENWESLIPPTVNYSLDKILRGVIAHELFHVVQGNEYKSLTVTNFEEIDMWLVEGSCNYFSNKVFELSNYFIFTLANNYLSAPLNSTNKNFWYSGVSYLQYIEWQHGASIVDSVLARYYRMQSSLDALYSVYNSELPQIEFEQDFAYFSLQDCFLQEYHDLGVTDPDEEDEILFWKKEKSAYPVSGEERNFLLLDGSQNQNFSSNPMRLAAGPSPIKLVANANKIGKLTLNYNIPINYPGYRFYLILEDFNGNFDPSSAVYIDENGTSITITDFGLAYKSLGIIVTNTDETNNYPGGINFNSTFIQDLSVPEPPTSLNAEILNSSEVRLEWLASSSQDVSYYILYRTQNKYSYPSISDSIGFTSSLEYVDNTFNYGTNYYYYLQTKNLNGYYSAFTPLTPLSFSNLFLSVPTEYILLNEIFEIPVNIGCVDNLFATSFDLNYDPDKLELLSITEGNFLNASGTINTTLLTNINNSAGKAIVGLSRLDSHIPGASSLHDTTLLFIKFKAKQMGSANLNFTNIGFHRTDLSEIYVTPQPAEIKIQNISLTSDLFFFPQNPSYNLYEEFEISVCIDSVINLFAVAMDIDFDPTILEVQQMNEGAFLSENGNINTSFTYSINNNSGKIIIGLSRLNGSIPGVTTFDVDTLFKIKFKSLDPGTSYLNMSNPGLLAPDGQTQYSLTTSNTQIEIIPPQPPEPFSLISPTDKITLQNQFPSFNWEMPNDPDPGDVVKFDLYYDTEASFSNPVIKSDLIQNNYNSTSLFQDNTIYYWKVRAFDTYGEERWSTETDWKFAIDLYNQTPGQFNLIEPDNSVLTTLTPTFSWSESVDPDPLDTLLYEIQIDTDMNFTNPLQYSVIQNLNFTIVQPLFDNTLYFWRAKVTDLDGASRWANQSYNVFTTNLNNENPVFSTTNIIDAIEDQAYHDTLKAADPDPGFVLQFQKLNGPNWLQVTSANNEGILSGIPGNDDVEVDIPIKFIVTDQFGLTDTLQSTFSVTNQNDPPVITSSPIVNATEDILYEYNVTATDPDVGDVLEYFLDLAPKWLSIDTNSGKISGIPVNSNVGDTTITVRVSDGHFRKASVSQTYILTVINVNDPPEISNVPDISFQEDSNYILDLLPFLSDIDNDVSEITLSASVLAVTRKIDPGDLQISIDQNNHTMNFTASPDSSGQFNVLIGVHDPGSLSDFDTISVQVIPDNDAPVISNPILTAYNFEDFGPFEHADLDTVFYDIENDPLTFTVNSQGNFVLATLAGSKVNLTSQPDFFGNDTIIISADDNVSESVTQFKFGVNIWPVNDPPVFSGLPDTSFSEDDSIEIDLNSYVTDIDDPVSGLYFNAHVLSASNNKIDTTDLEITIDHLNIATISSSLDSAGLFTVSFSVYDTSMASDSDTLSIRIINVNDPPRIQALPQISFNEDQNFDFPINNWYNLIHDPETPDSLLFYSTENSGNHVYSNINNGIVHFSADTNWYGLDTLILIVSDGTLAVSSSIPVHILPVNDSPLIVNLPDSIYFPNDSTYTLDLINFESDVDLPDDELFWTFQANNQIVSINYDTLAKSVTLTADGFLGNLFLFLTLTDNAGLFDSDTLKLVVGQPTVIERFTAFIPKNFHISQNYPNPFNPITVIEYGIPKNGKVQIDLFNMVGQRVRTLVNEIQQAGYYSVKIDASNLSSGVYFYKMVSGNFTETRKMLLIR